MANRKASAGSGLGKGKTARRDNFLTDVASVASIEQVDEEKDSPGDRIPRIQG